MKRGDVVKMLSARIVLNDGLIDAVSYKAPKGERFIFMLLGSEPIKGDELDPLQVIHEMGWTESSPSQPGHETREAAEALSRSQPSPARGVEAVRVKALEWSEADRPVASALFGYYRITPNPVSGFVVDAFGHVEGNGFVGAYPTLGEAKSAAQADHEQRIRSALEPAPARADAGTAATHRHKKRGTEYVLLGFGKMQTEDWADAREIADALLGQGDLPPDTVDMREVAIYRSVDDGSLWVRPREEFEDGRFEPINPDTGRGK